MSTGRALWTQPRRPAESKQQREAATCGGQPTTADPTSTRRGHNRTAKHRTAKHRHQDQHSLLQQSPCPQRCDTPSNNSHTPTAMQADPAAQTSQTLCYAMMRSTRSRVSFIGPFPSTFSCFGPHIWNSLPQDLRHCSTLSSFKAKLKTFLFSQYFHPN